MANSSNGGRTAKFQFIEIEHILIGICSLEKVLSFSSEESGLNPQARKALLNEHATMQDLLEDLGLDMTQLRRKMRQKLGTRNYEGKILYAEFLKGGFYGNKRERCC